MVEENNDIILVGGDALIYLAEIMRKKYSTAFAWSHPFSTYLSYDRFFKRLSLYASVHILDDQAPLPSPFPQLRTYLWMAYFSTRKQIRTFENHFH